MATKRVQEIVERFVAELVEACEQDASESIQTRLREALGTAAKDLAPIAPNTKLKRRKTTKGYSVLRPCPIPGCENIAAPRHQMVCKKHGQELTREEIVVARDNANKEGGIWFALKAGRAA
jgi:hypothetical protein